MIDIDKTKVTEEEREIIIKFLKKHPEVLIPIIDKEACGALIVFSKDTSNELYEESQRKDAFVMIMALKLIFSGVAFALFEMTKPQSLESVSKDMINQIMRMKDALLAMNKQEKGDITLN